MNMKLFIVATFAVCGLMACSSSSGGKGGGGGDVPTAIDLNVPQGKVLSDEATAALKARFTKGEADFELTDWIYEDEKKPDREQSANEKKWVAAVKADCSISQKKTESDGNDEELHVGQRIVETTKKSINGTSCPIENSIVSQTTVTFESMDANAKQILGKIVVNSDQVSNSNNEELISIAGLRGSHVTVTGLGEFKIDESKATTHVTYSGEAKANFKEDELIFAISGEGISIQPHQADGKDSNESTSMMLNLSTQILGEELKVTIRLLTQDGKKTTEYFINGYAKTEAEMKEIFGSFVLQPAAGIERR